MAHALIDNGFEIVYTGLRKSVAEIVQKAVDNDVQLIGLSILSGTHLVLCEQMNAEMLRRELAIPWIVGGNIPDSDVEKIRAAGAAAAFATGTTIDEVVEFCNRFAENHE